VISEAIVAGTPVIASRIAGNVGLLGEDYPGYFEVGETAGLAALMMKAENDAAFLAGLASQCRSRAGLFSKERERKSWRELIDETIDRS
jgi:glycosyltransferase involved in cell wall biosynthesis